MLILPKLDFFTQKNIFTGSYTNKFRYRITAKDENLLLEIWYQNICYDKAEKIDKTFQFALSEDGIVECAKLINDMCESYC